MLRITKQGKKMPRQFLLQKLQVIVDIDVIICDGNAVDQAF